MNNYKIINVEGTSMAPFLKDGDKVVCEFSNEINDGDIVLIEREEKLIIHRQVKNHVKGDNLKRYDFEYGLNISPVAKAVGTIKENEIKKFNSTFARLISFFSRYNHAKLPVIHRLFDFLTKITAKMARGFHERF